MTEYKETEETCVNCKYEHYPDGIGPCKNCIHAAMNMFEPKGETQLEILEYKLREIRMERIKKDMFNINATTFQEVFDIIEQIKESKINF